MEKTGSSGSIGPVVVGCSPALTGSQRRHLRGLGHHLSATVQIGARGVHQGLVVQLEQALADHELVKIRVHGASAQERRATAQRLHAETGAQVVQILGRTVLMYRPHPEEPTIKLPPWGGEP